MEEQVKEQIEKEIQKRKKNLRFWLWVNLGVLVLAVFIVFGLAFYLQKQKNNASHKKIAVNSGLNKGNANKTEQKERIIDGRLVDKGRENLMPIAVMIDNHIDARPWSGVDRAVLVYEAEAEGGITRLLAIFPGGIEVKKIGPVRSARPYFIDWASEFRALYVHVGGSPEALANIIKQNINDMNEFSCGGYFWRDRHRDAPHNVYTNTDLINAYLSESDFNFKPFATWQFKEEKRINDRPSAQTIDIAYSRKDYSISWRYDKEGNKYTRYFDGRPQKTQEGKVITAKNIIIQYAQEEEIDEKLRLRVNVLGRGKAKVCREGECRSGMWIKDTLAGRTRYYNNSDNEFQFIPGNTWIEIMKTL